MKKQILAATLAMATALACFAGCGGAAKSTAASSSAAASGSTAASGSAAASSSTASGQPITFKLSHTFLSTQPMHLALKQACDNITKRTNGQINFEIYEDSQIAVGTDGVEQCLAGANLINVYDAGCLGDWVPDFTAYVGPCLYRSQDEFVKMSETATAKDLCDQAYKAGVKVLSLDYCFGMRELATNKKAVRSLDDLKNLKLRVPNSSVWVETFKDLGANPVAMSWSEIYNALQTGVVEGMESSISDIYGNQFTEVLKYITLTNHMIGSSAVMLSAKVWDSLTPEQQQIMQEEFSAGATNNNTLSDQAETEARSKMEASGVEFITVDPEPFEKAAAAFYTNYPGLSSGIYDKLQSELTTIRAAK